MDKATMQVVLTIGMTALAALILTIRDSRGKFSLKLLIIMMTLAAVTLGAIGTFVQAIREASN